MATTDHRRTAVHPDNQHPVIAVRAQHLIHHIESLAQEFDPLLKKTEGWALDTVPSFQVGSSINGGTNHPLVAIVNRETSVVSPFVHQFDHS